MTRTAISFGSNLGERVDYIRRALEALVVDAPAGSVRFLGFSQLYKTEPVDVPAEFQNAYYVNAAALFETSMEPFAWSDFVHGIEEKLGRVRTGYHHPRTIDLDILFYGDVVNESPHLHLPHPAMAERRFVCQPLADVAPDYVIPAVGKTPVARLAELPAEPAVCALPFSELGTDECLRWIATLTRVRGWTIGCAESCTAGMLASALATRAGASSFLRGGVVTYATQLKAQLLDVDAETLRTHGPVCAAVAEQMARGALARLECDLAVSVTGNAGPDADPAYPEPVGSYYIGIATRDGSATAHHFTATATDRTAIREEATHNALLLLLATLRTA